MVLKQYGFKETTLNKFENDVKMYGTQAVSGLSTIWTKFENDVKMYGTQAGLVFFGSTT